MFELNFAKNPYALKLDPTVHTLHILTREIYFYCVNKGLLSAEKGRMAKKTVRVYTVLVKIPHIKEGEEREKESGRNTFENYIFFSIAIFLIRPTTQLTNCSTNTTQFFNYSKHDTIFFWHS